MKDIHIGDIIKQKVEESPMTVTKFADRINCERTTVYHIFKQKSIDIDKLIKISEVLNYDFISEVYAKKNNKTNNSILAVYFAVEIDRDSIQQLTLPDNFIQLIKK